MVAALLIYHLAFGLLAAAAAWGLERLAVALRWPRRAAWASALLVALLAPFGILLDLTPPEPRAGSAFEIPATSPSRGAPLPVIERPATPGFPAAPIATVGVARRPGLSAPVLPEWDRMLSVCWLTSSLLSASLLLVASRHLRRQIRRLPSQQVDGVAVRVAEHMGPAVFGWHDPQIVLPRWLLDSAHRATVLAHERSHAQAHDSLLFNLSLAALTLAPWNPFLWWMVRRLRFAIEVDCDRRVLSTGLDLSTYAQTLLQVAQLNRYSTFGGLALIGAVSQLGARVHAMTVELSRPTRIRLAASALGAIAASIAAAAQVEPPNAVTPQQAEEKLARDVRDILLGSVSGPLVNPYQGNASTGGRGSRSPSAQATEMRQAMNDPERRRDLLEEQRASVELYNPDLIDVIKVDAQTAERLLNLLAEQSLRGRVRGLENLSRQLEGSRTPGDAPRTPPGNPDQDWVYDLAAERGAIKEVLGDAAFFRYLEYLPTVRARFDLLRLTSRMDAEPLTPAQREQMVGVMLEAISLEREEGLIARASANDTQVAPNGRSPPTRGPAMSPEQTQALLKGRELTLQRMVERGQRLLQASAPILSPSQLAALSRLESNRIAMERRSIEALRQSLADYERAAGPLPPAGAEPPPRRRLSGQLRWSMLVTMNESTLKAFSFTGALGDPVTVSLGPKLTVEAIPTAFDTERFVLDMKIYEIGAAGTRHMIEQVQPVFSFRDRASPDPGYRQKFDTTSVGSEAYALSFSIAGSMQ